MKLAAGSVNVTKPSRRRRRFVQVKDLKFTDQIRSIFNIDHVAAFKLINLFLASSTNFAKRQITGMYFLSAVQEHDSKPILVRLLFARNFNSNFVGFTLPNYIRLFGMFICCLLYTSPSPRDLSTSRMPSSA